MASNSSPDSSPGNASVAEGEKDSFSVSTAPVVPEHNGERSAPTLDDLPLPRFYGMETLWLLPRDPHSLFAYWDIDWRVAFGEQEPRPREVQLRILEPDDSAATSLKVEPMAGYCSVSVPKTDTSYFGEIGFFDSDGFWKVVSRSATIAVPPKQEGQGETADFATIPMHLSFQQMLDSAPREPGDNGSVTALLARLRKNAAAQTATAAEQQLARALVAAEESVPASAPSRDLWAQHRLESIVGFGNSSLSGGFGGSSRS